MNSEIARDRIVEITGDDNFEIGLSHGTQLQKEIITNIDFYLKTFNQPEEIVRNISLDFYEKIKSFDNRYAEEIEGIAKGAKVPLWQICMLNARSEIFSIFKKQGQNQGITECTLLFFPETAIIAENWDWALAVSAQTFLLKIIKNNENPIITLTEAGILAKIGLNSFGIGIGMNYLEPVIKPNGIPLHILIRAAFDAENFVDALNIFKNHGYGVSGNICLAQDDGNYAGFELDGQQVIQLDKNQQKYYCHTNHFLGKDTDTKNLSLETADTSTFVRFLQAKEIVKKYDQKIGKAEAIEILSNQDHSKFPIFVPQTKSESLGYIGTICQIILSLKDRSITASFAYDKFEKKYNISI